MLLAWTFLFSRRNQTVNYRDDRMSMTKYLQRSERISRPAEMTEIVLV